MVQPAPAGRIAEIVGQNDRLGRVDLVSRGRASRHPLRRLPPRRAVPLFHSEIQTRARSQLSPESGDEHAARPGASLSHDDADDRPAQPLECEQRAASPAPRAGETGEAGQHELERARVEENARGHIARRVPGRLVRPQIVRHAERDGRVRPNQDDEKRGRSDQLASCHDRRPVRPQQHQDCRVHPHACEDEETRAVCEQTERRSHAGGEQPANSSRLPVQEERRHRHDHEQEHGAKVPGVLRPVDVPGTERQEEAGDEAGDGAPEAGAAPQDRGDPQHAANCWKEPQPEETRREHGDDGAGHEEVERRRGVERPLIREVPRHRAHVGHPLVHPHAPLAQLVKAQHGSQRDNRHRGARVAAGRQRASLREHELGSRRAPGGSRTSPPRRAALCSSGRTETPRSPPPRRSPRSDAGSGPTALLERPARRS